MAPAIPSEHEAPARRVRLGAAQHQRPARREPDRVHRDAPQGRRRTVVGASRRARELRRGARPRMGRAADAGPQGVLRGRRAPAQRPLLLRPRGQRRGRVVQLRARARTLSRHHDAGGGGPHERDPHIAPVSVREHRAHRSAAAVLGLRDHAARAAGGRAVRQGPAGLAGRRPRVAFALEPLHEGRHRRPSGRQAEPDLPGPHALSLERPHPIRGRRSDGAPGLLHALRLPGEPASRARTRGRDRVVRGGGHVPRGAGCPRRVRLDGGDEPRLRLRAVLRSPASGRERRRARPSRPAGWPGAPTATTCSRACTATARICLAPRRRTRA